MRGARRACSLPASLTSASSSCPKATYAVLDTWHVGGLRGSGSHDVVVDDVLVPAGDTLAPGSSCWYDAAGPAPDHSHHGRRPRRSVPGHGARGPGRHNRHPPHQGLGRSRRDGPRTPDVLADIASHSAAVTAAESHLRACMTRVWNDVGQRLRPPRTGRRCSAQVSMPAPSRAPVSRPCTPPRGLRRSTSTVRWSGPYAI